MKRATRWWHATFRQSGLRSGRALLSLAFLALSGIAWWQWQTASPLPPPSVFAATTWVGISAAPPDTRVYFSYENVTTSPTLRIVLGQSKAGPSPRVRFRITTRDSNEARPVSCDDTVVLRVCGSGDGRVDTEEFGVITGEFDPTGEFFVDVASPDVSTWHGGATHHFRHEFLPLDDSSNPDLQFPERGVEVSPNVNVRPGVARYDSTFPSPSHLYPGGWAFTLPAPHGGPIDVLLSDLTVERRADRKRDLAGLLTGLFIGLFAENSIALFVDRDRSRREVTKTQIGEG